MAALKYPLLFDRNMPFVHFSAYDLTFPIPSATVLTDNLSRGTARGEVALYMPGDVTENINASYAPEDIFQGAGGSLESVMLSNLTKAAESTAGGEKVIASFEAGTGKVPFPTDINIFRSVDPMSFSLNFNMIPYNKDEGTAIISIINMFKANSVPKGDSGVGFGTKNAVLNFPPAWDIYFSGINGLGIQGMSTDKITYQFMNLINCSVSYVSGVEGASVYTDGNPTQVRLSLTFQSVRKMFIFSQ